MKYAAKLSFSFKRRKKKNFGLFLFLKNGRKNSRFTGYSEKRQAFFEHFFHILKNNV